MANIAVFVLCAICILQFSELALSQADFPGCSSVPPSARNWIRVECNHTTSSCECNADPNKDQVCYFCLEIQQRHSFTRYFLDNEILIPGFGGLVTYFNETDGSLLEYPSEGGEGRTCVGHSPPCTEAFTTDGNSFRTIIAVNNMFPGPTLIVPNDYLIAVDVYNKLNSESTSIHWHGMFQRNTPWMDGVEHITQCGIAPGSSFRYIFRARPSGTHWYHAHSAAQRTDGLFGALIVRESEENYNRAVQTYGSFIDRPGEHTLTLIDWQRKNTLDLFTQFLSGIRFFDVDRPPIPPPPPQPDLQRLPITCSPDGTGVSPINFWSGLINGLGRHNDVPYTRCELSVFSVSANNTYRFRLVGAQNIFAFRLSIDEHRLTLIAADGHLVRPREVDFIIIHSGESYDFLLQTKAINPGSKTDFVIRAETLETNGSTPSLCVDETFLSGIHHSENLAMGILHYTEGGATPQNTEYEAIVSASLPKSTECINSMNCEAMNCPFENYPSQYGINCSHIDKLSLLVPVEGDDQPDYLVGDQINDNTLFFNFGFEGDGFTSAINGRNFLTPNEALQLSRNTSNVWKCNFTNEGNRKCDASNKFVTPDCFCTSIHDIKGGQTYRFVFTAIGPDRDNPANYLAAHPVHLHGQSFHVTKIGFGKYTNYGRIEGASDDVQCTNTHFCTNPGWTALGDPDSGLTGPIPITAPLKDTVLIPSGGYAVVYFKANNPGYWLLHCHIELHQLEGMAVVINASPGSHNAPPPGMGECGQFTWEPEDFRQTEASPRPLGEVHTEEEYQALNTNYIISFSFAIVFGVLFAIAAIISTILAILLCKFKSS